MHRDVQNSLLWTISCREHLVSDGVCKTHTVVFCSGHNLESKYFVFVASTEYCLSLGVEEFSFYSHIRDKAAEEDIHIPIAIGLDSEVGWSRWNLKQNIRHLESRSFRSGIKAHWFWGTHFDNWVGKETLLLYIIIVFNKQHCIDT